MCQNHLEIELYLFFEYLGIRKIWREWAQIPLNQVQSHKKKSKVFNSLFHIKWDLALVSEPSVGWVIPVSQVLRYWGNLGKLGPNTPNHVQGHMKSNPKLLVSHQIKPCSSVRTLFESSYTCFTGSQVLGQFGEIGPKYSKLYAGTHEK